MCVDVMENENPIGSVYQFRDEKYHLKLMGNNLANNKSINEN